MSKTFRPTMNVSTGSHRMAMPLQIDEDAQRYLRALLSKVTLMFRYGMNFLANEIGRSRMTPSTLGERRLPEPPPRLLPLRTAPSRAGSTISSNASHLVPDRLQGFDLSLVHLCQKFREPKAEHLSSISCNC